MVWIGVINLCYHDDYSSVNIIPSRGAVHSRLMTWIINIVRIYIMSMVIADIGGSSMDLYLPNNNF